MTTKAIEAGARADLLPCPFCGAEGHTLVRGFRYRRGSSERESTVWCPACDCRGPLKSWNTRAIASGELVPEGAMAAERERCAKVAHKWTKNSHILLHAGEMKAQELRTVKAVATAIESAIRAMGEKDHGK